MRRPRGPRYSAPPDRRPPLRLPRRRRARDGRAGHRARRARLRRPRPQPAGPATDRGRRPSRAPAPAAPVSGPRPRPRRAGACRRRRRRLGRRAEPRAHAPPGHLPGGGGLPPRVPREYRRAARAEIGVAADAWTLLFVGSGFERKGLATAVDALAVLSDRSSRLIVVGKGSIRSFRDRAVRLGVDGRITWLGPRPDIERWYAAADVVVLPSRYEPFGNVHLEALASGVPVVASAAAGGAEAIVDGGSGAVVDPRDAGAVATALGRLRERNPAELAEAARRAAEPFTFAAQVAGFAGIYRRITPATCDFP